MAYKFHNLSRSLNLLEGRHQGTGLYV